MTDNGTNGQKKTNDDTQITADCIEIIFQDYMICKKYWTTIKIHKYRPIKGFSFDLILPDGTRKKVTTDDEGKVREPNIDIKKGNQCIIEIKSKNARENSYQVIHYPKLIEMDNNNNNAPQPNPKGKALEWSTRISTGGTAIITCYSPCIIFDSHMHIQSSRCAPLPLLWKNIPLRKGYELRLARKTTETIIEKAPNYFLALSLVTDYIIGATPFNLVFVFAESYVMEKLRNLKNMAEVSKNLTSNIGYKFRNEMKYSYKDDHPQYCRTDLLLPEVVLPMDMDYAHLDGYYGIPIYIGAYENEDARKKKKPTYYWFPYHENYDRKVSEFPTSSNQEIGEPNEIYEEEILLKQGDIKWERSLATEDHTPRKIIPDKVRVTPIRLEAEEVDSYENWWMQLRRTKRVVAGCPWDFLPMYHYEPRRWCYSADPLFPVKEEVLNGFFIGIKLYTALGYMPLDERLSNLKQLYEICVVNTIPIINHCTPEGMPTFERESYLDYYLNFGNDKTRKIAAKYIRTGLLKGTADRMKFFQDLFVRPRSWEQVLDYKMQVDGKDKMIFRNLRLCLAHFGGTDEKKEKNHNELTWFKEICEMIEKYPNLYVDISSSFTEPDFRARFVELLKDNRSEKLRDRILFGTDWYLTLISNFDHKKYCSVSKETIDGCETNLWEKISLINPLRFFRLDLRLGNNTFCNALKEERKKLGFIPLDKTIDQGSELMLNAYSFYRQKGVSFD